MDTPDPTVDVRRVGVGQRYELSMASAVEVLRSQWQQSGERLEHRLDGLTDAEYFWEPVPGCWSVVPDASASSGWTYPYEAAIEPAPVTTIAWRLVHIAADNWIYWEHAFGPQQCNFPDLAVPSTAADALLNWRHSRKPVTAWLGDSSDGELDEPRPSHLGSPRTAGEVVAILIDEQVHHGAEMALLRDLYLWTPGQA